MARPLAEIEQDIVRARSQRLDVVSPEGVAWVHAKIDRLLTERDEAVRALGSQPAH